MHSSQSDWIGSGGTAEGAADAMLLCRRAVRLPWNDRRSGDDRAPSGLEALPQREGFGISWLPAVIYRGSSSTNAGECGEETGLTDLIGSGVTLPALGLSATSTR